MAPVGRDSGNRRDRRSRHTLDHQLAERRRFPAGEEIQEAEVTIVKFCVSGRRSSRLANGARLVLVVAGRFLPL